MRLTGGLIVVALAVGLVGCSGPADAHDSARYDAMLAVEEVPGVLVAPYEHYVQVDPAAPAEEIVETALGVRTILDALGADRPRNIEFVAVYPGDGTVYTRFTTRVYGDADRFERDVRIWAGLLDEGFSSVRYNVFDEAGDGVLNVHSDEPGESSTTMGKVFDAMIGALGDDAASFTGLQTEAIVDGMRVTNRSGDPALPAGWEDALADVAGSPYIAKSVATFEPGTTTLRLTGGVDLTAEQAAEVVAALAGRGVLQPTVSVTYGTGGDAARTTLYGAAQ